MIRVLGVDPGLTRCGIGVVEAEPGRPPVFVAAGVVRTSPDADHAHRLLGIENGLLAWFDEYRPHAVAVERVFAQHNVASVTGTAQAAGIAMLIAARRNLPIALHTPSEVKAAITGSGRADKAQVQVMVARVLHLAEAPRPADAADALALAICHVWRGTAVNRYAEAAALASTRRTYTRVGQVRRTRPQVGTRYLGPSPTPQRASNSGSTSSTDTAKGSAAGGDPGPTSTRRQS